MIPEGMKPEKAQTIYRKLVAEVKAEFAALKRPYAGEEVSHEIRRRWHEWCGKPFEEQGPEPPKGVTAAAPPVERPVSPIRQPAEPDMPPVVAPGEKAPKTTAAKSKSPAADLAG